MITLAAGAAFEVVKDVAHGIWKLLPPRVWLALALVAAAWWAIVHYGDRRHDQGIAEERGRWEEAQRAADRRAKAAQDARDQAAKQIDQTHAAKAARTETDTRKATEQAAQRADHGMHEAPPPPPGCPRGLPDRVRDEGRAAVERANRAGDPLRGR